METIQEKYQRLREDLRGLGSVAVAFSGGVDSSFLLFTAREVLGDKAVAVTASAEWFPAREQEEAAAFCREHGIRQILVPVRAEEIEGFSANPKDRCYRCKRRLFEGILAVARANALAAVADGANTDDEGDYRPGMRAVKELGVLSPLRAAGLNKAEIRQLSRGLALPTWDKPSFACLASRFVYGETISDGKLRMVDRAEQLLQDEGFRQLRVRLHGDMARIELLPEDFGRLLAVRERICAAFKELGFSYVTMDLSGYRTGSMNEVLGGR